MRRNEKSGNPPAQWDANREAARPPLVIIGHQGKMGRMLLARWQQSGYAVHGLDCVPDAKGDGPAGLKEEDLGSVLPLGKIVVLCVPVGAVEETMQKVGPLLCGEQVLMDITSVKTLPMRWMEENFSGPVIGAHPLFGPNPAPEDERVALVPGQKALEEHCRMAERLFRDMGCVTFRCTAAEHDCGVGFAQSLNFLVSATFFATLKKNPGVTPFLTPSFKRHLEAARKHLTQDTDMFCEFTARNPCLENVLSAFRDTFEEAARGNFREVARQAAAWYADRPEPSGSS